MRRLLGALCIMQFLGPTGDLAGQNRADLAALGRTIARSLDPLNGLPVVVLDRFQRSDAVDSLQSRQQAVVMATAFADELQIPVRSEDSLTTSCTWAPAPGDTETGLSAQFSEFQVSGDSATVILGTYCTSYASADFPRRFRQVHSFVLERTGLATWEVAVRRLLAMS